MVRITKITLHRTISDIMEQGDLDSLTTKKIRLLCEEKYNVDLTSRKHEIDGIVLAFVKEKSKEMEDEDGKGNKDKGDRDKPKPPDQSTSGVKAAQPVGGKAAQPVGGKAAQPVGGKAAQPVVPSSESSVEESGEEESGEDEDSSCSGSESCSNSECSSSETSDDESNKEVPAKTNPAKKPIANIISTSKQATPVASKMVAVASTSKQSVPVALTANATSHVISAKRMTAPPKKRLLSHSMNVADDVAAITAAAAAAAATAAAAAVIVPPKKQKIAELNSKSNMTASNVTTAAASVVPSRRSTAANNKVEMDDAAYARQLQAEEWNFRRGTINKLLRSIPQNKTKKVEKTKKKKACPFMKKCLLSRALAEVLGTNEMSRPDIVQKMWSVVKERNLFDPSNKQFVLCDEQLANIFGKKRIRLIGMMKYLKQHIKDVK